MNPEPRYIEALARAAKSPVVFQTDVITVFNLVSMLQLALRHPAITAEHETARSAREFIADFHDQMREREPLIAELVAMGSDPKHDIHQ